MTSENHAFRLHYDAWGRLILTMANGMEYVDIAPIRAFPITNPDFGVAICTAEGAEIFWIEDLTKLPSSLRQPLVDALAHREFVPEIRRILEVSAPVSPSQWRVETDRGETTFTLRDESDIRRLGPKGLLISDANGIRYLIRDFSTMDKFSRRTLDR